MAEPRPTMAERYPEHGGAAHLHGDEFLRDPVAFCRGLRERHGGVAPVLLEGDVPAWLVLGYHDFHFVTSHPELFSRDSSRWNAWDLTPTEWPLLPLVRGIGTAWWLDGPLHDRLSVPVQDALASVSPLDLQARCERIADALVDEFASDGRADLVRQYAERMPTLALTSLLDMPPDRSQAHMRDVLDVIDHGPPAVDALARQHKTMRELAADRRARPGFDVLSRLVAHPAGLTDDEVAGEVIDIFGLCHQSTSVWIGNTLRLMLADARFAMSLSGGRRSVGQAMEEVLWEDPPNSNLTGRWAVRASQLGGRRIQTGDMLILSVAAANLDPQIRPHHTVPTVGNQAHLAFGHGEHRCPYAAQELGETIARTAVEVMLDRLPDLTLQVEPEHLVWRASVWVRALETLPVTFTSM